MIIELEAKHLQGPDVLLNISTDGGLWRTSSGGSGMISLDWMFCF